METPCLESNKDNRGGSKREAGWRLKGSLEAREQQNWNLLKKIHKLDLLGTTKQTRGGGKRNERRLQVHPIARYRRAWSWLLNIQKGEEQKWTQERGEIQEGSYNY